MPNTIFKLSNSEKDILEKVIAISTKDKVVVKEVFKALLKVITYKLYQEDNVIDIPYVCRLRIDFHDKLVQDCVEVQVDLIAEPSEALKAEVKAISEGEITPTEEYVMDRIKKSFDETLGLEE